MVAEQHFYFCSLLQDDEYTAVDHQIGHHSLGILRRGLQDVDDLDGTVNFHILRHINQHTILRQHRVKGRDTILAGLSLLGVVFSHQLRIIAHRADNHALRQMPLRLVIAIKHIVHHEEKAGREVGHITAEGLVRVNGYLQAIEVQTIVGLKELLDIGIFIALHLFRWKALLTEVLKGLIAHGIHRLRGMGENYLPCLLV